MKALVEFTERFGSMVSRIFLTLIYFLVLGPFALLYQLVADPLRLARPERGNWWVWTAHNDSLAQAKKQD